MRFWCQVPSFERDVNPRQHDLLLEIYLPSFGASLDQMPEFKTDEV